MSINVIILLTPSPQVLPVYSFYTHLKFIFKRPDLALCVNTGVVKTGSARSDMEPARAVISYFRFLFPRKALRPRYFGDVEADSTCRIQSELLKTGNFI